MAKPITITHSWSRTWNSQDPDLGLPGGKMVTQKADRLFFVMAKEIADMGQHVVDTVYAILAETGQAIHFDAQAAILANFDQHTGNLYQSQKLESYFRGRAMFIRNFNDAHYAPFQEFGFRHWANNRLVQGRPFLFPAAKRQEARFLRKIQNILDK